MANDRGASKFGGQHTWAFSQGDYGKVTKKHTHTKNGICEALSVSWIAKDLQGGLQSVLTTGNKIDSTKIAVVAQRFASMYRFKFCNGSEGRMSTPQEMKTETINYLNSVGFKTLDYCRCSAYKGHHIPRDQQMKEVFGDLEGTSQFKQQGKTIYGMVRSSGPDWGHAMAMRIENSGDKRTYFFDPNYGEFMFQKYEQFKKWFAYFFANNRTYKSTVTIHFQLFDKNG